MHASGLWITERCLFEAVVHIVFRALSSCCNCADPMRRDVVLKTVARGNITMQGPMMLKQGYVGAIPRLAVFIPGGWNMSHFG